MKSNGRHDFATRESKGISPLFHQTPNAEIILWEQGAKVHVSSTDLMTIGILTLPLEVFPSSIQLLVVLLDPMAIGSLRSDLMIIVVSPMSFCDFSSET
jgi:hypothetical protein